jgi:hypothetical protein
MIWWLPDCILHPLLEQKIWWPPNINYVTLQGDLSSAIKSQFYGCNSRYMVIWWPPYGYLPPLQAYQFGGHQTRIT